MSVRGAAPATLADALALLEPGDDVFFWMDRDGRAVVAREPVLESGPPPLDGPPVPFFGICPFWATPSHAHFSRYAEIRPFEAHATGSPHGAAPPAEPAPALAGDLAASADRDAWRQRVRRALDVIESGTASKIVLARSVRLRSETTIDAPDLARAMMGGAGTFRYVIRQGETIFAGASPERLIEKRGDVVRTEAVAGTAPAEHDDEPLDERDKDRREHLAVVLAIDEALAPLTLALEHADAPLVRKHGRLAHLVTPFEGRVGRETHVLELAAALHPTPAVAGTPRDVALDFIALHEGLERGFYAGPVGWIDSNGDGELAVALRCVRVEGHALDLYAGAGIVAGSDPDAEFDETVLKMTSTLRSLGFELDA